MIFAPSLIAMFNSSPEVVAFGAMQARTEALFYCVLSLSHCMAGIIRGAGKTMVPMLIMLICWCVIRVAYITITVHFITWMLSSVCFTLYYFKGDWMHNFERLDARRNAAANRN